MVYIAHSQSHNQWYQYSDCVDLRLNKQHSYMYAAERIAH